MGSSIHRANESTINQGSDTVGKIEPYIKSHTQAFIVPPLSTINQNHHLTRDQD